jgi:hypothetical protein
MSDVPEKEQSRPSRPQSSEKEGVERWLRESGFPLEMRVAATFRAHDFSVSLSTFFEDADTQKQRELAVLASTVKVVGRGIIGLTFAIECKKSTAKPWVLFSADTGPREDSYRYLSVIASDAARSFLFERGNQTGFGTHEFLSSSSWVGYGLRQAHAGGDEAYSAIQSVMKAGVWLRASGQLTEDSTPDPFIQIILPTIVIEGSLYACFLNSSNEAELTPIDRGLVMWPHPVLGSGHRLINVLTEGSVNAFAEEALRFRDAIKNDGREQMTVVAAEWWRERQARQQVPPAGQ